jgi:hypothetical protein
VTSISLSAGTSPTAPVTATVTINGGRPLHGGFFTITVHAASVLRPSGVQDLAGNALDGEFYGAGSVSGNGVPGGDFVANITAFHNFVKPPRTIIGFPHPNDPAGRFSQRKHPSAASGAPSIVLPRTVPQIVKTLAALASQGKLPGKPV